MKMSVHGSRSLGDERVKILLIEAIQNKGVTEIVTHAEPAGVCLVARRLASEMAIPLKLHFLNFRYLRGAFEKRSKAVLSDCDFALCVHDGNSRGTANEIKVAKKMGVEVIAHVLEPSEHKVSVGFGIDEEWDVEKPPKLEPFSDELESVESGEGSK